MKHLYACGFSALLISLTSLSSSLLAKIPLIEAGKSHATLVISAADQKEERLAAEQLQAYLQKMTGAQVGIRASDTLPTGPAILIGQHPASQAVIAELAQRHPGEPEAFAIVSRGEHLHLVGQSQTATLWAACEWLETLGVRWLIPTPKGEFVPKIQQLSLGEFASYHAPGMKFRGPAYWMPEADGFPPFADAIKELGVFGAGPLYALRHKSNWNIGLGEGEGIRVVGAGHSYMHYLPADRYHGEHPEWFNLIGGQRMGPQNPDWQVCFTNEQGAATFALHFIAEIESLMAQGYAQDQFKAFVAPNDHKAWCECEPCQKLVDTDGSATSMVFNFANLVAAHVHAKYPDIPIYVYAYWNHTSPASRIELAPNVIPELTSWTAAESVAANHAHPMFSAPNQRYQDFFHRWSEMADGISAYAYYGHYNWFIPWPMLRTIATDIPAMAADPKFRGLYSENHMHWATQAPNFYLQNKLMWDPNADAQAIMEDYFRAAHGPAAEAIQAYYQVLEDQMASLGNVVGETVEVPQFLTAAVIRRCRALIDRARTHLGDMDEAMRWRTELTIDGWDISEKFARAVTLAQNPRGAADRRQILRLIEEIRAYMATEQGSFAFETRLAHPQIGFIEEPLTLALDALPAGTHTWGSSAANGGAFNFWAEVQGLIPGIWGYYTHANHQGSLKLPLRAESGRRITGARVRIDGPPADQATLRVRMSRAPDGRGGTTQTVTPNTFFDVPANQLRQRNLFLEVEVTNLLPADFTVLYAVHLELTVE